MTERLHFHFPLSCIGEGNGNPLQRSCLENPRDSRAWWAVVCGVAQSQTRLKWLSSRLFNDGHSEWYEIIPRGSFDLHFSNNYWCWASFHVFVRTGRFFIIAAKLLQLCPTLCEPIDGSPPGSTVPGILQARTLEWVAISFSNAWKWKVKVKSLSRVQLLATPWTAAYQAPPSMRFSRQEHWSGVPLPSPDLL